METTLANTRWVSGRIYLNSSATSKGICATYNKSSHLRILRGSSSWIWGETLIQYKILLKEMWKRTQCPVPKLFTSDCCRGENEFFSEECHTGVSVQGQNGLASTNKMPMSCLLLCFYSLIFWGGAGRVYLFCFILSLPFSLSLGCFIFTLNDGLIIFYVSFFFWWERKEEEKKKWSGVCKKWEGSWNSREGIELILIWCFSLNYLKRNI